MSSSALSHAVAALEARLGVRLFNRTTRSVALTAAGEQFVAEVAPALAAIQRRHRAGGRASRQSRPASLRLNLALGAARMILEPLVLEYMRRYPEVQVELVTEGALIDVVGPGLRRGGSAGRGRAAGHDRRADQAHHARSIVVGSPAYFAGRDRPKTPMDLMAHRCIRARMASGAIYRWEFEKRGEAVAIDVPGHADPGRERSDAAGGAGRRGPRLSRGLCGRPGARAAARLVAVLEDWTPAYPGLRLYYPTRRHTPAKLRAFIDLVKERAT